MSTHRAENRKRPKTRTRVRPGAGGFTLVETMIAICVLAVGLLAVGSMQIGAFKGNADARRITEETERAQDVLETLRGLPYDHDQLLDVNGDGWAGPCDLHPTVLPSCAPDDWRERADYSRTEGDFNMYWYVAEEDPLPNTKRITVVVTRQVGGDLKTTRISTVRSDW